MDAISTAWRGLNRLLLGALLLLTLGSGAGAEQAATTGTSETTNVEVSELSENWDDWLTAVATAISTVFMFLATIYAGLSARAARKSVEATRQSVMAARQSVAAAEKSADATERAVRAPVFADLWNEYGSKDMFAHMRKVNEHKEGQPIGDFVEDARYVFNFYHRLYIYNQEELVTDEQLLGFAEGTGYKVSLVNAERIMAEVYSKLEGMQSRTNWCNDFTERIAMLRSNDNRRPSA